MMECLTAIVECGGDVEEAATWLREKGLASAPAPLTSGASIAPAATDDLTVWCGMNGQEENAMTQQAIEVGTEEEDTATLAAAEDEAAPPPSSEKLVAQETHAPAPTAGGGGGRGDFNDKLLLALSLYGGSTAR